MLDPPPALEEWEVLDCKPQVAGLIDARSRLCVQPVILPRNGQRSLRRCWSRRSGAERAGGGVVRQSARGLIPRARLQYPMQKTPLSAS
jgi:hypothetical protein